jgi:hypothetical protein
MKPVLNMPWRSSFWIGSLTLSLAFAGCDRGSDVKMQRVPKESATMAVATPPAPAAETMIPAHEAASADFHGSMATSAAPIKWKLPDGWSEKALSQMRVGSFDAGKAGAAADVSIVPLPSGGPQMETTVINMWRSEVQLPATDKDDATPVTIGSAQGKLFEIAGGPSGRIVGATLDRDGTTWYFKMRGDDATVREQKPAFVEFLKSISFEATPAVAAADPHAGMNMNMATDPGAPAPAAEDKPATWTVPGGWKELPAPPGMLVAKYQAPAANGSAEINIAMLGGTGGGLMMNVNRWRRQLGLAELTQEEEWSKLAQSVTLPEGSGTLVDMTGPGQEGQRTRLVGIIVPRTGATWFYKLMGNEQAVGQQKDAFLKFVQSAKYAAP